jgi:hypothetical protein
MIKSKKSALLILAPVAAFAAVVFILPSYTFFGPVDTFPRLYKTARCSDPSWSMVAVYQKKAYWFASDTDVIVRVSDGRGKLVHEERQIQNDYWMRRDKDRTYAGYCNKTLFVSEM